MEDCKVMQKDFEHFDRLDQNKGQFYTNKELDALREELLNSDSEESLNNDLVCTEQPVSPATPSTGLAKIVEDVMGDELRYGLIKTDEMLVSDKVKGEEELSLIHI